MMQRKKVRNIPAPEQWKRLRDTNYFVSDQGRVKHLYKNGHEYLVEGTLKISKRGNKQIVFKLNGKQIAIKNVVWEVFRGKPPAGYRICHKNMRYRNNSLYNLQLCTVQECGSKYGGKNTRLRLIKNLDNGEIYQGTREAGRLTFSSRQTISDICNGKTKRPSVNVAWWDRENQKAYRGEYRYAMCEI